MTDSRLTEALRAQLDERRRRREQLEQALRDVAEPPKWMHESVAKATLAEGLAEDELAREGVEDE